MPETLQAFSTRLTTELENPDKHLSRIVLEIDGHCKNKSLRDMLAVS